VGRFLLPQLLARQVYVYAVSRHPPEARDSAGPIWISGDLFRAVALPAAAFDVAISLGPLDAFAAWFERDAPSGLRRIIALSSMSAESKRVSSDPAERSLAERLLAAEARLARAAAARNIEWTVFRPTLIYGAGGDRSLAPIARFARRWRVMPLPLGARGLRQPVHAADIADAVLAAVDCTAAHGKVYPLGGGERLRFNQLLWRVRAALPGFVLPLPVPRLLLRALRARTKTAAISGPSLRRLRDPLVADNSEATRDFGYAPRAFVAADVLASER
jgi:nucleoside-diphosphate-sugar epimerase